MVNKFFPSIIHKCFPLLVILIFPCRVICQFIDLSYLPNIAPQDIYKPLGTKQYDLLGSVKEVTTTSSYISTKSNYKSHGVLTKRESKRFNKGGNLIEQSETYNRTLDNSRSIYEFDPANRLTEIKHYKPVDSLNEIVRLGYNEKGNAVTALTWSKEYRLWQEQKIEYDSADRMVLCIDTVNGNETYNYDRYGNLIELKRYDANQKLNMTWTYEYDTNHQVNKEVALSPDSSIFIIKIYKFDSLNHLYEKLHVNSPLIDDRYLFYYGTAGRKVKVAFYAYGRYTSEELYSYNELGYYIKYVQRSALGHVVKTTDYLYDKIGNWIKSTTSFSDFTTEIKEREIIYYD